MDSYIKLLPFEGNVVTIPLSEGKHPSATEQLDYTERIIAKGKYKRYAYIIKKNDIGYFSYIDNYDNYYGYGKDTLEESITDAKKLIDIIIKRKNMSIEEALENIEADIEVSIGEGYSRDFFALDVIKKALKERN